MQKNIQYISPRMCILWLSAQSRVEQLEKQLRDRHGKYIHLFNLTPINFDEAASYLPHTNFKWRGPPYSLTETIKVIMSMDAYLRYNGANSVVICVNSEQTYHFALFLAQAYLSILGQGQSITNRPYLLDQFTQIYKDISISYPPIKMIESIEFSDPISSFIPIFEIFTEGRYNGFESVYFHNIQYDLSQYYLKKNAPLGMGIGDRCYDERPEGKYLQGPVCVFGDVKIVFYSYEKLVLKKEFVVGFNTKALAYDQTVVEFAPPDLYEGEFDKNILITLSQYEQGVEKSKSYMEMTKKIHLRYTEAQLDLQKLCRKRAPEQCKKLLSL